jgi:prolyl-tRNA synthetase
MKLSKNFTKTTREAPADEVAKNAQLLIRAGYIFKTMAGVYAYLPLGLRMLNKIENIVRRNMNAVGGQEILMNTLHPKSWWETANRWDNVDVLFKLESQTGNEYAIACSHEEQVVPIASSYFKSYKDLPNYNSENGVFPLSIYQIQTKFRDELRAKSGLLRGREFRMKDMYDFHTNKESQDAYYEAVKAQYFKTYEDLGLKVYATTASGGIFTTNISHEFQAECEAGEDWIYKDTVTGEVYNEEMTPCKAVAVDFSKEEEMPIEHRELHDIIGVEALCKALGITSDRTTKTLFFEDREGKMVVAVVRGDRSVNEEKLQNIASKFLVLASAETVMKYTGSTIGYAGVINLPKDIEIYFDSSVELMKNFETGTNKTGFHSINVCFGRDLPYPKEFYDLSKVQDGDTNPISGGNYERIRSAEVGNIFKLDDKYTKAFGVTYNDENNKPQIPLMNCHGIGTSRCMAILAELYSDDKGLCLPRSVAPFEVCLITSINPKDEPTVGENIMKIADLVYDGQIKLVQDKDKNWLLLDIRDSAQLYNFSAENPEFKVGDLIENDQVLWDDREGKISLGEKLKDADLIGMPLQLIITKRGLEAGSLELIIRSSGEKYLLPFSNNLF